MIENDPVAVIDAGGTTFKCAILSPGQPPLAAQRFATTTPEETLMQCANWFDEQRKKGIAFSHIGIATFGPVCRDSSDPKYGTILDTPKPGWANTDLIGAFSNALNVPVALDTDVNGALLAEMKFGAAQGVQSAAYVTIGTGIGAGIFANGGLIGQPSHPEFGHIRVQRHPRDSFPGRCSFHKDCLEGLSSAAALTDRFGDTRQLGADHIGWEFIADYLAQACVALTLSFRLDRIILGGGLMLAPHLIGRVRMQYLKLQNGYLGETEESAAALITTPELGDDAGLQGAAVIAKQ